MCNNKEQKVHSACLLHMSSKDGHTVQEIPNSSPKEEMNKERKMCKGGLIVSRA